MGNPTLSIIVPVYRVEKYIDACIESILKQDFSDFELILVDDGSPDGCGLICDDYARRDCRIKTIHQSNQGLSGARNTGIAIAQGDYLTFVDSDDTVSKDAFAPNMALLKKDLSIDLLEYPVFIEFGSAEQRIWKTAAFHWRGNIFKRWIQSQGYEHSYAWNKIYKRELFNNIRFPYGKTFEDIYTLPEILKVAQHYLRSDQGLYYYLAREGSISRKRNYEQYEQLLLAYYRLYQYIDSEPSLSEFKKKITLQLINWMICLWRCNPLKAQEIIPSFALQKITLLDLIRLDICFRDKIKNLPFIIGGVYTQCRIYSLFKSESSI